jgi:hypothetical protein
MQIVESRTLSALPAELHAGMTSRIRSSWYQVHYHTPKVHYEVWLTRKTNRIEIGLHFEGTREFSYLWAELMAGHAPEIMGQLGPEVEFEEWTPSWTRIHQSVPYDPLSEALAVEVAQRMSEMIVVLQPIVEMERVNVPAELEGSKEAAPKRTRFGARKARRVLG